jgi:hypothetical protein
MLVPSTRSDKYVFVPHRNDALRKKPRHCDEGSNLSNLKTKSKIKFDKMLNQVQHDVNRSLLVNAYSYYLLIGPSGQSLPFLKTKYFQKNIVIIKQINYL